MPSPARALIDSLPDEVLALIFTAAAAPDRLRCEQVCRRWRRILLQDDFVEHLVLPHDTSDDSPSLETTPEGWSMLREQVRDDSLIAASDKARGRLRTLDVSGCSEVSHNAVISVLRKNQKLAHVKMAERQADGHRLRIRPRQLVDVACALGKRANGTPATLEASVDVAGNRELEALRDVVVDAARAQRSSASASTSGSAPRAVNPLVVGGTRVVISSLTLSLLFLERVLLEANDDAFDAEDDADENDAEASVARETARVAATHVCEIIRAVGPRGLSRVTFGERALVDGRGASRVLEALRENCGAALREIQVDGEALRQTKTRLDLTQTLRTIGRAGGAARVTIKRAWLNGDRRGVQPLSDAPLSDTSRVEGWVSIDGDVGTFGSEKLHLEAADARLVFNATLSRQVDAFSVAKPPDGGGRNLRSASSASTPGAFCEQHELAVSMNLITMPVKTPRYFDVSNLNMRSGHLAAMLSLMDMRMRPWTPRSRLRVLAISGNGVGDECPCESDARDEHLGDALARAVTAHAETLHTLDIGGLPRHALSRAIGLVASLPALNVLDLSATPLGGFSKEKKRRRNAGPEDDAKRDDASGSKSLSRLLGDALGTPGCSLRSLVLVSCSLTAPQLRDIVSGAVKTSTVTDAVLSYNSQLGDDGCEVAARWIRGGSKKTASRVDPDARGGCLLRVSLEGCGVTDVGAKTLAAAVVENRALRRLDLAANVMIRAAGRKALADAKRGRSGIWTSETVDDTPWAGSDTESDDEFLQDDEDEYHSEDDGYFASHKSANAARPSRWALLD